MNYKDLMESGETTYLETDRFKHFKDAQMSERYFSNYISYKTNPSLLNFQQDMAYLATEQAGYASDYSFVFFAEKAELTTELKAHLEEAGFETLKHLIFTNQVTNLRLSDKSLPDVSIVPLGDLYREAYFAKKYQDYLAYGTTYADQMQLSNQAGLPKPGSQIFLAIKEEEIIGDVTAWYFGEFVEVDDFRVDDAFQGQGIGSALQKAAIADYEQVILIAEEENRDMYQHQGYQEASWYWTALRSPRSYTNKE
ncbi:GNAT family N-acetyltransferase [Streptococcus cameli]